MGPAGAEGGVNSAIGLRAAATADLAASITDWSIEPLVPWVSVDALVELPHALRASASTLPTAVMAATDLVRVGVMSFLPIFPWVFVARVRWGSERCPLGGDLG